jgi:hypothetical protein
MTQAPFKMNFVQQAQIDQLSRHTAAIKQFLDEVKPPKNRLSEFAFKDHFVPLFAGALSGAEREDRLGQWYFLAGSPYKAVDIVRPDGSVFEFPALFDRSNIALRQVEQRQSLSLESMANFVQSMQDRSPIAAKQAMDGLINEALGALSQTVEDSPANIMEIRRIIASYIGEPIAKTAAAAEKEVIVKFEEGEY